MPSNARTLLGIMTIGIVLFAAGSFLVKAYHTGASSDWLLGGLFTVFALMRAYVLREEVRRRRQRERKDT